MSGGPHRPGGLRIGVVGVGHLGTYHLAKYLVHPAVAQIHLFDPDPEAVRRALERADPAGVPVRAAATLDACLAASEAVSIAVPTAAHAAVARPAIAAGCHLLIEKPLAATAAEAGELAALAGDRGCILQVGHVERFNPALEGLDVTAVSPRFIETHRLAPWNPRGTDVGVVLDLMVHDLDLILHLVGESPAAIAASGVGVITAGPDIANARLTFPGGCVANVTASRVSLSPMRKLRIFQPSTYISLDLQTGVRETIRLREGDAPPLEGELPVLRLGERTITRSEQTGGRDALEVEIDAFIRTVAAGRDGTAPTEPRGVTGPEAIAALELAEEITRLIDAG